MRLDALTLRLSESVTATATLRAASSLAQIEDAGVVGDDNRRLREALASLGEEDRGLREALRGAGEENSVLRDALGHLEEQEVPPLSSSLTAPHFLPRACPAAKDAPRLSHL